VTPHSLESQMNSMMADRAVNSPIGKMSGQTFKLLRRLDSPNETEVLAAARALVSNLRAAGSDLRTLSDALEAEWKKQEQRRPRARPATIDSQRSRSRSSATPRAEPR
jgi:hypothetical protein